MTDLHIIIRNADTFDTIDYPFGISVTLSGGSLTVTYYSDAAHTAPSATATYSVDDYIVYVVPS